MISLCREQWGAAIRDETRPKQMISVPKCERCLTIEVGSVGDLYQ